MDTTPALDALTELGLEHEIVRTGRARSVEEAARMRGVSIAALIKSLVVRLGEDNYLFVLVPGDRGIDWAKLRAHLNVRRITLPDADEALAATGYERGTITPFGATTAWPIVADASISGTISLGGGDHGVSVTVDAQQVFNALGAVTADVTKPLD